MSDVELYKRALEREKKARLDAEKMLDEKSREVYTNMLLIEQQFDDLQQRKNNLELLVAVSKFTQEEKGFVESIEEFSNIVGNFTHALFTKLHLFDKEFSDRNDSENDENILVKSALKTGESVSINRDNSENSEISNSLTSSVSTSVLFDNPELNGLHAIPIKCYSDVVAVIEVGVSNWKQFPKSIQKSASVAASQLGIALERRLSTKQLRKNHEELLSTHQTLMQAQQQLVNSEKLASIGQLAAGVAHEINNPIGFVISNINTLGEYVETLVTLISLYDKLSNERGNNSTTIRQELEAEIKKYREEEDLAFILDDINDMLEESSNGMRRVKEIVSSLKNFARTGNHGKAPADINQCIENTIKVVWNDVKYQSEINTELGDLPQLTCNVDELSQVFLNLIINANQSMEGGGLIAVKTWQENAKIFIQITDNGCGIEDDKLKSIFDPFFTTKPVGVGTGLGLSIAYGIIEDHSGIISVKSKIDEGTSFTIELPIEDQTTTS